MKYRLTTSVILHKHSTAIVNYQCMFKQVYFPRVGILFQNWRCQLEGNIVNIKQCLAFKMPVHYGIAIVLL